MERQKECFRCGKKFDPVRSDQMFCSKACRLKHYSEVRRALAAENKPQYVIKMVTFYPKEGKTIVSYFQHLTNLVDWVGESQIEKAHHFRTKKDARETLTVVRGCINTENHTLSVEPVEI